MDDFIQISPDVRFAPVVLSPEWGAEYQPVMAAVPVDQKLQHAERRAGERRSEQMALI